MTSGTTKPPLSRIPISLAAILLGFTLSAYQARTIGASGPMPHWAIWRSVCTTLMTVGVYGLIPEVMFGRIRGGWLALPIAVLGFQQTYAATYNSGIDAHLADEERRKSVADIPPGYAIMIDWPRADRLLETAQLDSAYVSNAYRHDSGGNARDYAAINGVNEERFGDQSLCAIVQADRPGFGPTNIETNRNWLRQHALYPDACIISYPIRGAVPTHYVRLISKSRDGQGIKVVDQDGKVLAERSHETINEISRNPIIVAGCNENGLNCLPHFSEGRPHFLPAEADTDDMEILGLHRRTTRPVMTLPNIIADEIKKGGVSTVRPTGVAG